MSKFHTVMLSGYDVPSNDIGCEEYDQLVSHYKSQSNGHCVIGSQTGGFSVADVVNLANNVRLDISAHGRIKQLEEVPIYDLRTSKSLEHQIQVEPNVWTDTADIIDTIIKNNNETQFFEIHIWSCFGGSSVSNFGANELSRVVSVLPQGSIIFAHGPVIIDAWSVNLYQSQLASLEKRAKLLQEDQMQNSVLFNLPHDAIECLSVGMVDLKGHKHQFNMRTIPISSNLQLVRNYLLAWVNTIQTNYSAISKTLGMNFKFALEFHNDEELQDFMKSMLVTTIRSSPKEFLVTISHFEDCYRSVELLSDEEWEDIKDTNFQDDQILNVLKNTRTTGGYKGFLDTNSEVVQSWYTEGTRYLIPGDRQFLLTHLAKLLSIEQHNITIYDTDDLIMLLNLCDKDRIASLRDIVLDLMEIMSSGMDPEDGEERLNLFLNSSRRQIVGDGDLEDRILNTLGFEPRIIWDVVIAPMLNDDFFHDISVHTSISTLLYIMGHARDRALEYDMQHNGELLDALRDFEEQDDQEDAELLALFSGDFQENINIIGSLTSEES